MMSDMVLDSKCLQALFETFHLAFVLAIMSAQADNDVKLRDRVKAVLGKMLLGKSDKANPSFAELAHADNMSKLILIVDELLLDESKISPIASAVNKKDLKLSRTGKVAEDDSLPWPAQYGRWGKIPSKWCAQLYHNEYKNFTNAALEFITKNIKHAGEKMLEFGTGLKDNISVDTRLHDKAVMAVFVKSMLARFGNRLKGFLACAMSIDGGAGNDNDFSKYGCFAYEAVDEQGLVTHVRWRFSLANGVVVA
jgi:hypothetical protein